VTPKVARIALSIFFLATADVVQLPESSLKFYRPCELQEIFDGSESLIFAQNRETRL
jgi:hypothetical protein